MTQDTRDKIITLGELAAIAESLAKAGRRLVLCHGDFDLLHPGHVRHLEAARRFGDALAVAMTGDAFVDKGPNRPFFNERLRAETLAAMQAVDYVVIHHSPGTADVVRAIRPAVLAHGSEESAHPSEALRLADARAAAVEVGAAVEFTNDIQFSATQLLNTHFPVFNEQAAQFLREFRKQHSDADVIGRLRRMADIRVLSIGDTIIDEYHFCRSVGKASKSANITAKFLYGESYAGGTVAVANQAAGFCREVELVTCLGDQNPQEDFLRGRLKPNVRPKFFGRPDGPTVVKRRFVDPFMLNKMFEVSFFNDDDLPPRIEREVSDYLAAAIPQYDLVLVSDFGHGFLGPTIRQTICEKAKYLAVNVQTNSQNMGFNLATKYPRADFLCVDEQEARLAGQSKYGPLDAVIRDLAKRLKCRTVAVTRGGRGATIFTEQTGFTDVPTFSGEVVDTVGAGDAFLSIASLCAFAGESPDVIGTIGNAVGALAVRIVGNKESVAPEALFDFLSSLLR